MAVAVSSQQASTSLLQWKKRIDAQRKCSSSKSEATHLLMVNLRTQARLKYDSKKTNGSRKKIHFLSDRYRLLLFAITKQLASVSGRSWCSKQLQSSSNWMKRRSSAHFVHIWWLDLDVLQGQLRQHIYTYHMQNRAELLVLQQSVARQVN
ncbi:unnamed protein product [Phytophthora lilii]|uniref:Unnamed protein product n=1 Tax=Phytophthora lilii TaxID=2077276 RepID=A0A9W7CIG1_9STRA|nr:unnamed protein product [Phytophthora lilii]